MTSHVDPFSLPADHAAELIRVLPDAAVIINASQNVVYLNPAAEQMLLIKNSEVLERPLDVLMPRESVKKHRTHVHNFLESQEAVRWLHDRKPLRAKRRNGEEFLFQGSICKLYLSGGLYAAAVMRELSWEGTDLRRHLMVLQERVKELNLLYDLSQLQSREDLSLQEALKMILEAIPRAWHFPEHATVRIHLDNLGEFRTLSYGKSDHSMREEIRINDRPVGEVEIAYPYLLENVSYGPFLPEEHELLKSVASSIGQLVDRYMHRAELHKLASALEQAGDMVIIADRYGIIEYVNPSFKTVTGYSSEEVLGEQPSLLKSGEHTDEFYSDLWHTILEGRVFKETMINRARDGTLYYESKTISPIYDQQGNLTHFLSTGRDVTQQLQTESRLRYLASHDALTGLLNHGEFVRQVDWLISSRSQSDRAFAVAVLGPRNLRSIHEILGQRSGEQALKILARRLLQSAGESAARISRDMFALILEEDSAARAARVVEDCLDDLSRPMDIEGEETAVFATAGLSWHPQDSGEGGELVQKAETAMHRANQLETDRIQFYSPEMQRNSLEQLRLRKDLAAGFQQSEYTVCYQPQVHLASGRIAGAEALARWQPLSREPSPPGVFIPVLEEMGLIGKLGDFVLRSASDTCKRLQNSGLELPRVAVNFSAQQLEDPDLIDNIWQVLQSTGLAAQSLEVEITESLLLSPHEGVTRNIENLTEMGISIALDDFGTGYSFLQYLSRYPLSKLKIDKSFIWSMMDSRKDKEVVRAMISLGKSLGVQILAEGAERQEHMDELRAMGCDYVQGYFYSPPLPEGDFEKFLRGR